LSEVKEKLRSRPDYITLSGSGEPTLYSRIGDLIERIRSMTDTPIAVLTNGSLLWQEEVCDQIMAADLVIPSLDAGSAVMFATVNRPHQDITFEKLLNGLVEFRRRFTGRLWVEVFLLAGYTADSSEIRNIAKYADLIRPERVQLNTVARPPAEAFALPVEQERLLEYASMFTPQAEIIADFRKTHDLAEFESTRNEVINLLRRRPCSVDDLANGLGIHRNEVVKYVEELRTRGLIEWTRTGRTLFYRASR
jgi:wyosine [tRNA(Phe)-imidazoG37] synthetase (radical SAM superfamily)